jgi:DNA-directed RNA polymerase specialized sigma24 family protein
LRQTQRKNVILFYIGEYSFTEVAQIQDTPIGTIKRRLHEARRPDAAGNPVARRPQ